MKKSISVDHVKREIIENKLLISLNDDDKVAVVLTKEELTKLIDAMGGCNTSWCDDFKKGLTTLYTGAFGVMP